jgi:hypothetical protein
MIKATCPMTISKAFSPEMTSGIHLERKRRLISLNLFTRKSRLPNIKAAPPHCET